MNEKANKALSDVISAHKIGIVMLPILEALSVNLRGSGIDNTKFSEAFSTITSRSSSTFHYLTKELKDRKSVV